MQEQEQSRTMVVIPLQLALEGQGDFDSGYQRANYLHLELNLCVPTRHTPLAGSSPDLNRAAKVGCMASCQTHVSTRFSSNIREHGKRRHVGSKNRATGHIRLLALWRRTDGPARLSSACGDGASECPLEIDAAADRLEAVSVELRCDV